MPRLHAANKTALEETLQCKPSLICNFTGGVFGSATFDFGPSSMPEFATNWLMGTRAISAGGHYDFRTGGHIVLKELRLLVELPACATILLPSSIIAQGTVRIQPHEHRVSLTQCTSGGILRRKPSSSSSPSPSAQSNCGPPSSGTCSTPFIPSRSLSQPHDRWIREEDLFCRLSQFSEEVL